MKYKIAVVLIALLMMQVVVADKQDWQDAKQARIEATQAHQDAKLAYNADKTPENEQEVIDTAKTALHAALDEVEEWLVWKNEETQDADVPNDLKQQVRDDVQKNKATIEELRGDVDGITNGLEAGLVWLKIVGKYVELLADVARNSGYVWVHVGNEHTDKLATFEEKLRDATNDPVLLTKLDIAKGELETARNKIKLAEGAYDQVKVPGTPLIKFGEGNAYLRQAHGNLVQTHVQLQHVMNQLTR